MNSPVTAAQLTHNAYELFKKSIEKIQSDKIKSQLSVSEKIYAKNKISFERQQEILSNYQDRNRDFVTARAKTKLKLLKDKYNLAYQIYTLTAKELESKRNSLLSNKINFTVIDDVAFNPKKVAPRRLLILISFGFIGLFLGVAVPFLRVWLMNFVNIFKD